ncbi:hypothetical protein BDB00DRAFT_374973 [Zychaea mexicana]|uniref:uncharacterized protein n=1 Tax=Zychaea mexicana TaxID=64656 RepID=UPI0022FEA503|nr:uncharacterized protein BDB00DRAFT_374973 [Zychaea mexicana]KAI9493301.1 hypothetical protein BDB00DRAFT_374973 [Zychaea mexicana]
MHNAHANSYKFEDEKMEYHHSHRQDIVPPPSPPSSSITDDEKLNVAPLFDEHTTGHLLSSVGNVEQAQHHLKAQRGAFLRTVSDPAPQLQQQRPYPQALMDIHRLAIEALQKLYADECHRNGYLEEQAHKANEKIMKQEVSRHKRVRKQEQKQWQRVYGLADTVRDVSCPTDRNLAPPTPTSPEELQSHLRHILANITTVHHHAPATGSLVVDLQEQDPYLY